MLTEARAAALEKAKSETDAHCEFESEHPGYCGARDTIYVGNMKGVGQSWIRKSAQGDKWSFCLTAGTLCPANQERQ